MKQNRSTRRLASALAAVSAVAAALLLSPAPVSAQAAGGTELGTFGDWRAYRAEANGNRICYAVSQPQRRLPEHLNRGPGFLFVSFRPSENVSNEVAAVMGFPTQEGQAARGVVDGTTFAFVTRGENVWVQDPNQENAVVESFVRGRQLELRVTSARGNDTTDVYSLSGFTAAMRRAQQECGG